MPDEVKALLAAQYRFAKTMKAIPHEYTVRNTWTDQDLFNRCVQFIRDYGYTKNFYSKQFTYFNINGDQYWSYGDPIPETELINRAKVKYHAPYDLIADKYDDWFSDPLSWQEEAEIISSLDIKGKVLDVGCGTGNLLNHADIHFQDYVGIDPSAKMLDHFKEHHPFYHVINCPLADYYGEPVNTVISLFGSPSYLTPEEVTKAKALLKPGGKAYLMFYRDDYQVETYKKARRELPHYSLEDMPRGDKNYRLDKYEIREYHG